MQHRLRLRLVGGTARLPYAATLRYRSAAPPSCAASRVAAEVRLLGEPALPEGATAEVLVAVAPAAPAADVEGAVAADAGGAAGMTVVVVGLPGGLEARYDRLAEVGPVPPGPDGAVTRSDSE